MAKHKAHTAAKPVTPPAHLNAIPIARSPTELMEAGKRLREALPRLAHKTWKKPQKRADPIAQLQASDAERLPELVPVRYGRMLVSPFTFFRGAAGVMAADLATTASTGLHVQACGDCHLLNFGGFATPERNIIFDMNNKVCSTKYAGGHKQRAQSANRAKMGRTREVPPMRTCTSRR